MGEGFLFVVKELWYLLVIGKGYFLGDKYIFVRIWIARGKFNGYK